MLLDVTPRCPCTEDNKEMHHVPLHRAVVEFGNYGFCLHTCPSPTWPGILVQKLSQTSHRHCKHARGIQLYGQQKRQKNRFAPRVFVPPLPCRKELSARLPCCYTHTPLTFPPCAFLPLFTPPGLPFMALAKLIFH